MQRFGQKETKSQKLKLVTWTKGKWGTEKSNPNSLVIHRGPLSSLSTRLGCLIKPSFFLFSVSFGAFHAIPLFLHPCQDHSTFLTGTVKLHSSHLALHFTLRSCLSKVITSSKNILFLVPSFLRGLYRHYLMRFFSK